MGLRFTDGVTTVDLQTSPWLGVTYLPTPGAFDETEVTESAVVVLEGTAAAIRSAVQALEMLLRAAWQRQRKTGARVYVEFRPLDSDGWFRAEVLDGAVTWSSNPSKRRLTGSTNTVEVAVSFTRVNGWDGAEVELQLSTSNQAAATGGRAIVNHDDGGTGHDNWVQIASSQVAGDLPGPCRVQLTNTVGSSRTWTKLILALNTMSDPASWVHMLEGESRSSGGTVSADATASNGQLVEMLLSGSSVTMLWSLSSTQMQRSRGRLFRLLARIVGTTGTITATAEIRAANGSNVLWRGEPATITGYGGLIDLGAAPLPPGGYNASYGGVSLALTLTGTGIAEVDFVQLTPLDGYRMLTLLAACANSDIVVDDSAEGLSYVLSGSSVLPYVSAVGAALLLQPGVTQRLIVLAEGGAVFDPAPIDDAWTVRVWHRPRRLTI